MAVVLLLMSLALMAFAVVSLRSQVRTWRRLRTDTLASDDRRYLRGVLQRRSLAAVLILVLAALLAGAQVSGGAEDLVRISRLKREELTDQDREAVKDLARYWILVLGVTFLILVVAVADYAATSLYGRLQYRRIQSEQRALLERDLAVHRLQARNRFRGRR